MYGICKKWAHHFVTLMESPHIDNCTYTYKRLSKDRLWLICNNLTFLRILKPFLPKRKGNYLKKFIDSLKIIIIRIKVCARVLFVSIHCH